MSPYRIVALGGDGVGPEVTRVALDVLQAVARQFGFSVEVDERAIGCAAIDAFGDPLPAQVLSTVLDADAVLLGAVGSRADLPPGVRRAEEALLQLRSALGVWANLRPIRSWTALEDVVPVRPEVARGLDLLIVRELSSGLYYGRPQGIDRDGDTLEAVDTLRYTWDEVERLVRLGFDLAKGRRGRVASVDKANVLATSRLWREVADLVASQETGVACEHVLVDACAMRLLRDPAAFDVLVTENTFGDILSDEASMLAGSLGLLPSASLGGIAGLYEPVHGTAPDIAGRDVANPIGAVLSVAMLLRHSLRQEEAATRVESAVDAVLASGDRTRDLVPAWSTTPLARPPSGTRAFGLRILEELDHGASPASATLSRSGWWSG